MTRSHLVGVIAILTSLLPAQTTWTGAAGTGWATAANWSAGVPTATVDAVIPAGTPNNPSTAGVASAVCRDLTINSGATLSIAPSFPVSAGRNITLSGGIAGGGMLRAVTNLAANLSGNGTIGGDFEVAKTGTTQLMLVGNVAVNGNLTLTSGTLRLSNQPNQTMSVTGNAAMQGGVLEVFNVGILDVAGNLTFSGTTVAGTVPTIHCAGNFTADASFAPTTGLIVMDGVGAQAISGTFSVPDLTIATGSVTTAVSVTTAPSRVLTIDGALAVSGALDANGAVVVNPGGVLDLGGGTDTMAGNLTGGGTLTATGTLVFDGSSNATLSVAALPSVQVAKTGGVQLTLNSNVTVNGNLTLTSGTLRLSNQPNQTMTVTGNAAMQGGVLEVFNVGILDVAGNVTFSGTTVAGTVPTIRCAGNFTADAGFAPTSGTVELDGTSSTTIAHASTGGTMTFANLALKNGARSPANDFTIAAAAVTVDAGAALAVPTGRHLRVHRAGPTALNVNEALSVAPNGRLSIGPQTTATVNASGSLTIVGSPGQPATVDGESGGGYSLLLSGTIAARHFVVKEMGPAGMFVNTDATIAAAPNDIRDGTFDFRTGAPAGSVLLDIRRIVPTPGFDSLVFLNTPGATGVFNVTTIAGGMPISFTNWSGAFGGPSFENDLHGLITWNLQGGPPLVGFVVLPGAELAEVTWATGSDANVTSYQLFRAFSAAGPFFLRTTQTAPAPGYGFVDAPLAPNQPVFYALYALMSQAELVFLASGSATPYSTATPGNVKKVGGNGAFSTIQAAINAATDPNSVVWVTPGNYDSFTIGATALPSNLRILGDGTGPVNVSTANGPVQIMNVPAASGVEVSNLSIGGPGSSQNGIAITGCMGPVVLDELSVSCDGTHAAISVSSSAATAIQRSNIAGGTGLSVAGGSYVAVSRGSLSSLVSTGSTVEMAMLTPGSTNVSPPASLITRTGLMPDIDLPEFISLSLPSALFLDAQPNAPFVIAASPRLGFQTLPGWEMPFLLDQVALAQLPTMFTDGLGLASVGFEVPPVAALLGFSFTVQAVVGDPISGVLRFSNVESMVCIP